MTSAKLVGKGIIEKYNKKFIVKIDLTDVDDIDMEGVIEKLLYIQQNKSYCGWLKEIADIIKKK